MGSVRASQWEAQLGRAGSIQTSTDRSSYGMRCIQFFIRDIVMLIPGKVS